jgi:hypothetical protein
MSATGAAPDSSDCTQRPKDGSKLAIAQEERLAMRGVASASCLRRGVAQPLGARHLDVIYGCKMGSAAACYCFIGFGIGVEIVGHQWRFCGPISKTSLTKSKTVRREAGKE